MTEQKKSPELIETSLIWALSAVAGLLGFFIVWLICLLLGPVPI
jgi:nitrate reductase NapE component